MKKIITVILDGFGMRDEVIGNAVKQSVKSNFDNLWHTYPHSLLEASGPFVGLSEGQMGNSEVGHMAIGGGRLIKQKETLTNEMFANNDLENSELYKDAVEYAKTNNKKIHLMILASDGGVHSEISHLIKFYEQLVKDGITKIYFHLITDGRDTDPKVSYRYVNQVKEAIKIFGVGKIATVCGRYYAMDRDNKWDRTKKYYDVIVRGNGVKTTGIMKTIQTCYEKGINDEYLPPILLDENGRIADGDVLFWLNFRPDRARQILQALTTPNFDKFATNKLPNLKVATLYPVDKSVKVPYLLNMEPIENALGVYLSDLGLSQARIAETEKFAHVTTFFDCERTEPLENCDRFLIPSPQVETYDMKPEMSAIEVCRKAVSCMEKDYDYILVNFANPDMVGHSGDLIATIKAVQVVDLCLGKIVEAAEENFYTMFILADHGNAELVHDENGNPITAHTTNKVPFIVTDSKVELVDGDITQVAPTILDYMDITIPKEMNEHPTLFKKDQIKKTITQEESDM